MLPGSVYASLNNTAIQQNFYVRREKARLQPANNRLSQVRNTLSRTLLSQVQKRAKPKLRGPRMKSIIILDQFGQLKAYYGCGKAKEVHELIHAHNNQSRCKIVREVKK